MERFIERATGPLWARHRTAADAWTIAVTADRACVTSEDRAAIEEKTHTLMTASRKLAEKTHAGAQPASPAAPADDSVVDAEVKEVTKADRPARV